MTDDDPTHEETHHSPTYQELTGFQRDILQAIAAVDGEPYGLALKTELETHYPEPINHSRLYQNLDRLADQALLTRTELDGRTNTYELTPRARRLLRRQAQRLVCLTDRTVTDGGQA